MKKFGFISSIFCIVVFTILLLNHIKLEWYSWMAFGYSICYFLYYINENGKY